jgi:hypothetical protein
MDERNEERLEALLTWASRPVDGASLALFRIAFGIVGAVGAGRFLLYDWVDRFFVKPDFFFKYWGFGWVEVLPAEQMTWAFAALVVLGLAVAAGALYRLSLAAFLAIFTYVELLDVTNYLNHYYLVSLVGVLLLFLPAHRVWSVDGWLVRRRGRPWPHHVPNLAVWVLRAQVGTVYFFAGLAKMQPDWLVHAQPMNIWMSARVDTPVVGPLLDEWWVAAAMSWAGFLYDTTIPIWLSWRKTRLPAFIVLCVFHGFTGVLFNIGMFPWIMTGLALIFFEPGWPRRFFGKCLPEKRRVAHSGFALKLGMLAAVGWFAVQWALPLRHWVYPGDVLWNEQGMRWSWKVMVREKNGSVMYRVKSDAWQGERYVSPSRYLTDHQEREMSGQPDLILQLAHVIGRDLESEGKGDVEVRVDAVASLNGRRPAPLIDPEVDLMRIDDGIGFADWIAPKPADDPIRLESMSGQ